MSRTTTRIATVRDLPEVVEMAHALAAFHGDKATLTPETLARDALGRPPWITLLVAPRDRGLVGYTALCPLIQLQFGVRGLDMHHLFVREAARGTGVGHALIKASLAAVEEQGGRYLGVGAHPENHVAQAFYTNVGFTRTEGGPRFRIKLDEGA